MNGKNTRIISALKSAMKAETDGHYFYKMAAGKTKDAMGKETFLKLARDEQDHFDYLKAQYDSIMESGKPAKVVKMAKAAGPGKSSRIFSKEFKRRIGKAHFEMSALSIAIGVELSSIEFYRREANKAEEPQLKEFFGKLADWEVTHHQILVREQARLQEEYWLENRFYPF